MLNFFCLLYKWRVLPCLSRVFNVIFVILSADKVCIYDLVHTKGKLHNSTWWWSSRSNERERKRQRDLPIPECLGRLQEVLMMQRADPHAQYLFPTDRAGCSHHLLLFPFQRLYCLAHQCAYDLHSLSYLFFFQHLIHINRGSTDMGGKVLISLWRWDKSEKSYFSNSCKANINLRGNAKTARPFI